MASSLSFQGVTTGLQTDALISAIMQQEGQGVQRLKDRQTQNTKRSTALESLVTGMNSLTISMAQLYDSFNSRAVTSTDADSTFVTATASGAANGSYEVKVSKVATTGRLSSTMVGGEPTTLAVADPNAAILTGSSNSFAVQGTDGAVKTFQLANNSLNGLRDAINASGAGVTASNVNTGQGSNPYQLVLTSKDATTGYTDTGTGVTGGVLTLAALGDTGVVASLGITTGTLTVDTDGKTTGISGGLFSTGTSVAQDAEFSINGIDMTRKSNIVKDAVDGVTFTLKKGDGTNSTTLTVAQDKTTATAAMQDVITKYNAILTTYKQASTVTKDSTDSTGETNISGPLANDIVARSVISNLRSILHGTPEGMAGSATFKSAAELGIKTLADGTLSLDTTAFNAALDKDPVAVKNVFTFSGTTTNGSVSLVQGTSKTATGNVGFDVTYGAGGAITGSLTVGGTTYSGLTGTNGTLQGPVGSPLEGLTLNVTGSGTGTLTLSRGIGQKLQDMISDLTSYSGSIEATRTNLDAQNRDLATQIASGQANLDKRQAALQKQFNEMEATVAQLRTSSSSLSALS
jgi:flagellar hook-associated protein 2